MAPPSKQFRVFVRCAWAFIYRGLFLLVAKVVKILPLNPKLSRVCQDLIVHARYPLSPFGLQIYGASVLGST